MTHGHQGQVEKSPGSALAILLGLAFAAGLALFALARKPAQVQPTVPPHAAAVPPAPTDNPPSAAPALPVSPAPSPQVAELVGEQSTDRPELVPVERFATAAPAALPVEGEAPPPAAPYIRVLYPNGGETIERETEFTVRWESGGFAGSVKIVLKGGSGKGGNWTVAPSAPNTGAFVCKIPANYGYNEFRIVIVSADGMVKDESDAFFASKYGR